MVILKLCSRRQLPFTASKGAVIQVANFSGSETGNQFPRGLKQVKRVQIKEFQTKEFQTKDQWNAHFDACKQTNKLMVIDFTATWCGPCKSMEPIMKEFAATYTEVEFIKIDVDKLAEVAQEFEVEAMPTFILIKNGEVLEKIVGARKDELQNKIEKHRT